jgi:hypothetical protein
MLKMIGQNGSKYMWAPLSALVCFVVVLSIAISHPSNWIRILVLSLASVLSLGVVIFFLLYLSMVFPMLIHM